MLEAPPANELSIESATAGSYSAHLPPSTSTSQRGASLLGTRCRTRRSLPVLLLTCMCLPPPAVMWKEHFASWWYDGSWLAYVHHPYVTTSVVATTLHDLDDLQDVNGVGAHKQTCMLDLANAPRSKRMSYSHLSTFTCTEVDSPPVNARSMSRVTGGGYGTHLPPSTSTSHRDAGSVELSAPAEGAVGLGKVRRVLLARSPMVTECNPERGLRAYRRETETDAPTEERGRESVVCHTL